LILKEQAELLKRLQFLEFNQSEESTVHYF